MELFKNIKEFPEYTVYSDGRILTKKGNFMSIGRRKSNSGYIQVRLFKDNKYYYRYSAWCSTHTWTNCLVVAG